MGTSIELYREIKEVVCAFSLLLPFEAFTPTKGRPRALSVEDCVAGALFQHRLGIQTKKQTYDLLHPSCSYKTFVVNLNRWSFLCALMLLLVLKMNCSNHHPVMHIDSTDIPVCLFKNAHHHKTMKDLAAFGRSSKGIYFGLKLHLISDLRRKLLRIRITAANTGDRELVIPMSEGLYGILIADAGYVSQKLTYAFHKLGRGFLLTAVRKNMRKLMTKVQQKLYETRMLIELNFRNLKMFFGLITSLPRSVNGYLANYVYSLFASQLG